MDVVCTVGKTTEIKLTFKLFIFSKIYVTYQYISSCIYFLQRFSYPKTKKINTNPYKPNTCNYNKSSCEFYMFITVSTVFIFD